MREKLIELCDEVINDCYNSTCEKCTPGTQHYPECISIRVADHLIANGVTFAEDNNVPSKWISVKDGLPKLIPCDAGTAYSEAVNVLTSGRKVLTAIWDGFDWICDAEYWDAEDEEITHWTHVLLPLPPTAERRMIMTAKELAAQLDGNKYGNEITKEQEALAAENGLVVVFGYSDDNVELAGAIDDEVGAFDGTTFHITRDGVLPEPDCGYDKCKYFVAAKAAASIKAIWHDSGNPCWTYETDIPHETFRVYEEEELFCVGIVFSLNDLP